MKVTINKGEHYPTLATRISFFPWVRVNVRELRLTMQIDKSMFAFTDVAKCEGDSHKVFGITKGFGDHQKDSFRISYIIHRRGAKLPDAECVQFLLYDYVNSVLKMKFLPELYRAGEIAVIRHILPGAITGRTLPPYHGGDCTAPKTITYQAKCDFL